MDHVVSVNPLFVLATELDDFMTCCTFWALHDWILHKVDAECEADNLSQVKHISGLMVPHVRDHCIGYEHGSFTCRMLIITPIVFIALFVLIILSICVCANVSFYKWIRVRRKYQRVLNQDSTSKSTRTASSRNSSISGWRNKNKAFNQNNSLTKNSKLANRV